MAALVTPADISGSAVGSPAHGKVTLMQITCNRDFGNLEHDPAAIRHGCSFLCALIPIACAAGHIFPVLAGITTVLNVIA